MLTIKATTQEQANRRDTQGQVCRKGPRASVPSLGEPPSQHFDVFTSPKLSENHTVQGFYESSITQARMIKLSVTGN